MLEVREEAGRCVMTPGALADALPRTYVDWHCPECGYEHETDGHPRQPGKCSECGTEWRIRRGPKRLPVNRAWCDDEPKQYDICGGDKQVQVYLHAATGEHVGVVLAPEYVPDCDDDPVAVAEATLGAVHRYLYYGGKEKVEKVVAAMVACADESDANADRNRLHELRETLVRGAMEYRSLLARTEAES